MFESLQKYANEVSLEFKKVEWPSYKELVNSTIVVFVVIAVFALLVFGYDFVISMFVSKLIG